MKRRIYVAGAYTAQTVDKVDANIRQAEDAGKQLAEKGFFVYVPHLATAHWEDTQNYRYFADLHLTLLTDWATDIYMLPNWKKSSGSIVEHKKAQKLGLPIYNDISDLLDEQPVTNTRHLTKLISQVIPYETKKNINQEGLREILGRMNMYLINSDRNENPKLLTALSIVERHLRGKLR